MSKIDISRIREETRHCSEIVHFDNAGASLPPDPVVEEVTEYLKLEQRIGGYRAEEEAQSRIQAFYNNFGRLLNCSPHEIAYVENATRAWDMAFYSIDFKPGDKIVTATSEYASNYLVFRQISFFTFQVKKLICRNTSPERFLHMQKLFCRGTSFSSSGKTVQCRDRSHPK